MTYVQAAELVERIGIPTAIAVLIIWVLILVIQAGISLFSRSEEDAEENLKERSQLRADKERLIEERLALERKFTKCREELASRLGYNELLEHQKDTLVAKMLDETQDFERELLLKELELKRMREELLAKDNLIADYERKIADLQ